MSSSRLPASAPGTRPAVAASPAPRISVVIPTLDGGPRLREVVRAVLAQEVDEPFELLLADSESRDGVPAALARELPVRLLPVSRASFNHGATRNAAIAAATGEIVALLVQDAAPADPRWLATLVRALDDDPRAAGAYARQEPRREHPAWVREAVARHDAGAAEPRVQELTPEGWDRAAPAARLRAIAFDNVASAIRRSVWREVPFAEIPFGEDVDWARRVLLAGRRILYVPSARVLHSHDRGAWYELRRTYVCHRFLRELVGLVQVPDLRTLATGTASTVRANVRGARAEGSSSMRAAAAGVASVLGQYLGARPSSWRDRWLDRGV